MMKPRKRFLSLLSLTCFLFCTYSLALSPPYAMRISCGARENVKTPPSNTLWHKDFAYTGGIPGNASLPSFISPKLKTLRYFPLATGSENCYNINRVRKGHYAVRIFFGLVSATESTFDNEPLFDISIQGTQVRSLQSGWTNNDEESFTEALVFLTLGTASLCFQSSGHGDPSILSIEILQVDNRAYYFGPNFGEGVIRRTAERLSFGADKAEFDADMKGSPWGGDRFWNLITTFEHGSVQVISALNGSITGASVAPNYYPAFLYQTALASTDTKPELEYTLEVDPNRNYSVWFHFAEIDHSVTAAGQRVFDILINGDIIFHDVDIVSLSGGLHTALVLNTTILVSGRSLTITLHPTVGNYAIINAIEIFQVINAEAQTLAIEVKALQSLKQTLGLPLRLGWNGDPCVPQQHAWSGVDCQFDSISNKWVIDGLDLDNQGLRGYLPNDISKLSHLQTLNLSGNSIHGQIPASLGTIISLEQLDLSYNFFNGSIPENLGQLSRLQILNLNGNSLSGKVPADLGGRLLHRASFNFTDNAGLCGIPGLPTCGPHLSLGAKIGIGIGSIFALLLIITCATCWWKRRQNILRAQRIAARADAPYAKARTHYSRDVQMTRHYAHGHTRVAAENGPSLLA